MAEKKMQVGSLHHQMTTVANMDKAVHLYQDVLGLELTARIFIPSDLTPEDVGSDDVWKDGIDHIWEIATLDNGKGAPIELCCPIVPEVQKAPEGQTDYGTTGHTEQGFAVDDINAWYDWIIECGYRTQSEPWEAAPGCMTFCFYDDDGNVIQLYNDPENPAVPRWTTLEGMPKGDFRTEEQIAWAQSVYK